MKGLGKEDNHLKGFPKECTCELVQHPKSELQCHVCKLGHEKHEHVSMVGEDVVMHGPLTVEETNRYLHKMSVLHRNTGHTVLWNIWCVPWKLGAQILELWTWLGTFSVQFVRSLNVGSLDHRSVWSLHDQSGPLFRPTTRFGDIPILWKGFSSLS